MADSQRGDKHGWTLERQPLSSAWSREVTFSKWLEENVDYLDEVLGIGLTDVRREEGTGSFFCDLVAEDGTGDHVVDSMIRLERAARPFIADVPTQVLLISNSFGARRQGLRASALSGSRPWWN